MLRSLARVLLGGVAERWREVKNPSASRYPGVEFRRGASARGDCRFGEGVVVGPGTSLFECEVGRYTYFAASGTISRCRIGSFCSIGPHIEVGFGRHPTNHVSTYPSFYKPHDYSKADFGIEMEFENYETVNIGNDVWIGAHCLILDGATIGDGAVIGAGAVVVKDMPAYTLAGGVPARVIRQRFSDEQVAFLQRLKWWERDIDWIRAHAPLFGSVESLMEQVASEEEAASYTPA
jgi:acetyltransferase-like isoleucine patch superfamily enzyme